MTTETLYERDMMMTRFYMSHYSVMLAEDKYARDAYEIMIAEGILAGQLDNGAEMYAHSKILEEEQNQPMSGLMFQYMIEKGCDVHATITAMSDGGAEPGEIVNLRDLALRLKEEGPGGAGEPLMPIENLTQSQRELYDYLCAEESMMNPKTDMTTICRGIFNYVRFLNSKQSKAELARQIG